MARLGIGGKVVADELDEASWDGPCPPNRDAGRLYGASERGRGAVRSGWGCGLAGLDGPAGTVAFT